MVPWWNCIGDFGDSFCDVIACLCIGNLLKLVFSSSEGGSITTVWYLVIMALLFLANLVAEYGMWI